MIREKNNNYWNALTLAIENRLASKQAAAKEVFMLGIFHNKKVKT